MTRSTPPTPPPDTTDACRWRFGPFVLWEGQRRLERHGHPVRLGSREFGLLLELLRRAGEVVSKGELLAAAWSDVVVEEASVRVHMSMLRKRLGKPADEEACLQWIATVPLRGYCFLGKVAREPCLTDDEPRSTRAPDDAPCAALPVRLTTLVARMPETERLLELLEAGRLVTVTGCGGVGKTSLAIGVAERFVERRQYPVRFIDLAPLTSPSRVLATLARAVGASVGPPPVEQAIVHRLEHGPVLLLLDNCEHVIEALAPLADRLLAALPDLKILLTSREALGVAGEHVLRLLPFELHDGPCASLAQALRSPAVQLLVERATAAGADAFDDSSSGPLMDLCRQLDGIPLAMELAAARLALQGVHDLAARLDDHVLLQSPLNGAADARQRTMAASLAWSTGLLSEAERLVFRRLSIFNAHFDAQAAVAIVADALEAEAALDALLCLVRKSLVVYDARHSAHAPYRLLHTTRSHARALLSQAGEEGLVPRRHADLLFDRIGRKAVQATRALRAERASDASPQPAANWCSVDNTVCGIAWLPSPDADT